MGFRVWVLAGVAGLCLQGQWFAGGGGGISTLSADGQTRISGTETAISLYKPENGPVFHFFAGRDLTNYFSVQGSFTRNTNSFGITGTRTAAGVEATFQQEYQMRSMSGGGEGMFYFRPRTSRFRPYLSGGVGMTRFRATAGAVRIAKGTVQLPPATFDAAKPYWRTAVGIDVAVGQGWMFRYSFSEAVTGNPISKQLQPPGARGLADFQSIFGFLKRF